MQTLRIEEVSGLRKIWLTPPTLGILALDLGTETGFCNVVKPGGHATAGTLRLATTKQIAANDKNIGDPRFAALRGYVDDWLAMFAPTESVVVVWESVQFLKSLYQIRLWTLLSAAVFTAVDDTEKWGVKVRRLAVPVSTLKKHAGSGKADKDFMRQSAVDAGFFNIDAAFDDNAVDAIWLFDYARKEINGYPAPSN